MLNYHRLVNDKQLGETLFVRIGRELQARGIKVNIVTIAICACGLSGCQVLSSNSAWGCAVQ